MNKYVDLSVDFDTVNRPKILKYIRQYHIITDATLCILEKNEHGIDSKGNDALLSLCKYLVKNHVDVRNELYNDNNAPGRYMNNNYDSIYYIYDKNYLDEESAYSIAGRIAKEWCDRNNC